MIGRQRDACAASIVPCIRPVSIEYKLLREFEGAEPFPDILVRPVLERGSLTVSQEDRVAYLRDCEIHVSTTDCVYMRSRTEEEDWICFSPKDLALTVSSRAIVLKIDLLDQREGWELLNKHLPPLEERQSVKHPETLQSVSTEERSQRRIAQRMESMQDDFIRLISKFGERYHREKVMEGIERLEPQHMHRYIAEASDMYSARKREIIEAYPQNSSRFMHISQLAFVQERHGKADHHMNGILSQFLGGRMRLLVVNTIEEQDAVVKSDSDFLCKELFVRLPHRRLPAELLNIKGATPAMDYLHVPDQSNVPVFNQFLGNVLVVETFAIAKQIQRMHEAKNVTMMCLDCSRAVSTDGMARRMRPPPKDKRAFSFGNVARLDCHAMRKDIGMMESILEEARRVMLVTEASSGMRHRRDDADDDDDRHGPHPPKYRKH
jgi:hypothetical protein